MLAEKLNRRRNVRDDYIERRLRRQRNRLIAIVILFSLIATVVLFAVTGR